MRQQNFELRLGRPPLSIYDLAASGPKLQMKSNAKDEVKKERPDTTPASQ
jgi:hypothetical protein